MRYFHGDPADRMIVATAREHATTLVTADLYLGKKMSLAEMGRKMGNISASAFTQNRKRLMAKLQNDESLREHFQKLKNPATLS